jgi:hypothetical protein
MFAPACRAAWNIKFFSQGLDLAKDAAAPNQQGNSASEPSDGWAAAVKRPFEE